MRGPRRCCGNSFALYRAKFKGSTPVNVQSYKNLRAVYCPVGGSPSTKNKLSDQPKARMPTY